MFCELFSILLFIVIFIFRLTKTDYSTRPVPIRPQDYVLSSLLHNFPDLVYKYHEHDSLLENKPEQDLSEADKAEAWAAYEKDLSMTRNGMDANNMGDFPNINPNYRGMTAAGLFSRGGYPGYGGYGSFGLFNSPPYGSNMNPANLLPGYLGNSYAQSLASITNDPLSFIQNMRGMGSGPGAPSYNNPYGTLSPPSGQTSPFSGRSGYGGLNQNYYNPITPPPPIRPMSGGFASLSDMANFLAVPTSTPPPPAHISSMSPSSSTSIANTSPANLALDHPLWQKYFNRDMPGVSSMGYPKSTQPSSSVTHSSHNVTMTQSNPLMSISKPVSSTSNTFSNQPSISDRQGPSTTNISNSTNSTMSSLAKDTGSKQLPIVSTSAQMPQQYPQPSIPTSVIAKPPFTPIQIPPQLPKAPVTKPPTPKPPTPKPPTPKPPTPTSKPASPIVTQVTLPQKSPVTTSAGRYSPTQHVIMRQLSTTTTAASTSTTTRTTTTTTAASLVKNFNMGIVYPSSKDKNQPETLASYLQNSNSMVTILQNTPATTSQATTKKVVPTKIPNPPISTTIIRKGNSLVAVNQNKSATITPSTTRNIQTPLNSATKTALTTSTSIQPVIKAKTPYEINISELSKTSGLSITPIPSKSTSTAQPASTSSLSASGNAIQRITIKQPQTKPSTTAIIKPVSAVNVKPTTTATIKSTPILTKQPQPINKTVPPIRLTHVRTNPTISTLPSSVRSNTTISTIASAANGTVRNVITTASASTAATSSVTQRISGNMNPPQLSAVPTVSLLQNKRSLSSGNIERIRIVPTRQLTQPSLTTTNSNSGIVSKSSQLSQPANSKSMPPLIFATPKQKGQAVGTPVTTGVTTRR